MALKILLVHCAEEKNAKIAMALKESFERLGAAVKALQLGSHKEKGTLPARLPSLPPEFDLLVVGTPVVNFGPAEELTSFLRSLPADGEKKAAAFVTCHVLPGTTVQKISSLLSTAGAVVLGSLTVKSLFEPDEKRLQEAREFAALLVRKAAPS